MAEDSVLSHIMREFELWGVKPSIVRPTNGAHIEIRWQVSPDKEPRQTFLPKTGSDWRGWLNQRGHIRRLFKADGLSLKDPPKPEPVLRKALALPTPPPPKDDLLRDIRVELVTLSEMVFELADIVSKLSHLAFLPDTIRSLLVPATPPGVSPLAVPTAELPQPKSLRSIKAIDHVGANWNSTEALAESMGVAPKFAYRKLYYLFKKGEVEMNGSLWRKPPEEAIKPKANGNGHDAPAGVVAPKRRGRPPLNRQAH